MTKRFITIEGDNRKWKKMERPVLREVPFEATMNEILTGPPCVCITMDIGQWDALLQVAYDDGANLIEVDDTETPVRIYRKGDA